MHVRWECTHAHPPTHGHTHPRTNPHAHPYHGCTDARLSCVVHSCICPTGVYRHVYGACGRSGDVLVAMHTHHVVVLRDARVLWAAGVDAVPIALTVATLAGQRGMIVAMDETGGVGCYYLGTDPVMTVRHPAPH